MIASSTERPALAAARRRVHGSSRRNASRSVVIKLSSSVRARRALSSHVGQSVWHRGILDAVPSTSNSLVLGVATGPMPPEALLPFAHSLRETAFAGRFAIIGGKYTPEQELGLRSLCDVYVRADDLFTPING